MKNNYISSKKISSKKISSKRMRMILLISLAILVILLLPVAEVGGSSDKGRTIPENSHEHYDLDTGSMGEIEDESTIENPRDHRLIPENKDYTHCSDSKPQGIDAYNPGSENEDDDDDNNGWDWAVGGVCCLIFILSIVIGLAIAVWVYKDAEARGENGALWLVIILALSFVFSFIGLIAGVILWLIVRPKEYASQRQVYQPAYYPPPPPYYPPPMAQYPPPQYPPPPGPSEYRSKKTYEEDYEEPESYDEW